MANFSSVTQQDKLTSRVAPYWQRLAVGQQVGLRKWKGRTYWRAKFYDPATGSEKAKSLGDFGDLPQKERYDAAVKAAREWLKHMTDGGQPDIITVADACRQYVAHLEVQTYDQHGKRAISAAQRKARSLEARKRFERYVYADKIAKIALPKLAKSHVEAWRRRRASTGISIGTMNRDMVPLRSALNMALDEGYATSSLAWREKLSPAKVTDERERNYLTRDQRKALLAAVDDEHLRAFLSALSELPLRPGALAALTVADWDRHGKRLHVRHDKAGAGRKVPVPLTAVQMLDGAARDKLPAAPLFSRWDGKTWDRFAWRAGVRAAVKAAGLPAGTCAYELRHSVIADLVNGGLDMFTVGKLAGTSAAMIEKTYGKVQDDRARDAMAALALS